MRKLEETATDLNDILRQGFCPPLLKEEENWTTHSEQESLNYLNSIFADDGSVLFEAMNDK